MAATPQRGSLIFEGSSGMRYTKEIYISDVAAANITLNGGAGAGTGSPTKWTAPEWIALVDASIVTGTAETTKIQLTRDGVPTGDIVRYANHLTTLNNRPRLGVVFAPGSEVGAIQLA